ncbi:hypothetical protein DFH07DRAFT_746318 [Mycena maculata]|uniref:BTB domain-containing protein n=1 Tax=Mycena maculata TaxID=230809 RepID=A0AAD7ITK5_9AGAR|nr:hypothetical protein DFH07DRAFT_746318 [Mycena maculata]
MWGRPVHPRFWHADGDFMVQVENTDYKLHRHLFNRAKNFAPLMWGIQSNPYRLTETKVDFDRLLSILYPADYSEQELKTADEWSSVLLLADKWQIPDIRRLAIKELAACAGPVDKIALGHRYDIPEWLGPAYLALAMRKEPVTSAEGTKMGIAAMVRIAAIKDEVLANLTEYVDLEKFCDLFSKVVL